MKQIFWKSSIGNGNIVHYTFYQHFENPMLIRNRDPGTIKAVEFSPVSLRSTIRVSLIRTKFVEGSSMNPFCPSFCSRRRVYSMDELDGSGKRKLCLG